MLPGFIPFEQIVFKKKNGFGLGNIVAGIFSDSLFHFDVLYSLS